jgi:hypothetical protein
MNIKAWMLAMIAVICTSRATDAAEYPEPATKEYLVKLMEERAKRIGQTSWQMKLQMAFWDPLLALLTLEVHDPLIAEMHADIGNAEILGEAVTVVFQFPKQSPYAESTLTAYPNVVVQELPIARPQAILIVTQTVRNNAGKNSTRTERRLLEFFEQPDKDILDRPLCWRVKHE